MEMFSMRLDGYTLEEIGMKFGISKERVRQLMTKPKKERREQRKYECCVYPNLKRWLKGSGLKMTEFDSIIGCANQTTKKKLSGRSFFSKKEIDILMELTGMSYSELFEGEKA